MHELWINMEEENTWKYNFQNVFQTWLELEEEDINSNANTMAHHRQCISFHSNQTQNNVLSKQ